MNRKSAQKNPKSDRSLDFKQVLKSEGLEKGVYIRFGSTNRKANSNMLSALKLFAENLTYDELPHLEEKIDWTLINAAFDWIKKHPSEKTCESLGIFSNRAGKIYPTIGGILLFASNRTQFFPDSVIRCARFGGRTKEKILDQIEIKTSLPFAINEIIIFIERNPRVEGRIGKILREDIPEYPPLQSEKP